ncbi:hypothetical protein D3C86_2206810 [compost metagenome]
MQIGIQNFKIRVGPIGFDAGYNRILVDKTRSIVDMAVRVVTNNAVFHPQNLLNAVVVAQ